MVDRPLHAQRTAGAELRRRFVLLLVVRAAVVAALLGSTIFFNIRRGLSGLSSTQVILYAVAGLVFALTLGYSLWLRRGRGPLNLHLQLQVGFDLLVATLLVYITGGVESPFTVFFALPIIVTAVFYPRRGAMLTAGLSCVLLGALFILENQGVLPVDLEGRVALVPSAGQVTYRLAFNFALFLTIGWLAGTFGEQLRSADRELQKTEEEVEALTALNRDIVLSLRSGLMAMDAEGRVSLVNPVAETILGCDAQQALGRPGDEVFPSLNDIPAVDLAEEDDAEPPVLKRLEVEHRRSDGQRIPVGLTLSLLTHAEGAPAGTLVHMQDLTAVKAMQASMKKADRMAALVGMAAAIAHEIRNPLASISGSVQMLKRSTGMGDEQARLMDIILRETERLDGLLSDFLTFAKPKPPSAKRCDLKRLAAETVEAFFQRGGGQPPEVTCELQATEANVDPDQFRQVLWNLLANADQALDGGGRITVSVWSEGDVRQDAAAWVEVADEGPGIPKAERDKVFDPFFTTKAYGTGLGLAIVHQIVEAHGGRIELVCPDRGGCRFRIRIPGGPC